MGQRLRGWFPGDVISVSESNRCASTNRVYIVPIRSPSRPRSSESSHLNIYTIQWVDRPSKSNEPCWHGCCGT